MVKIMTNLQQEHLLHTFGIKEEELLGRTVLFSTYETENYSGQAFALLIDPETKTLYEVNGSHCSCNGLEFDMEETTIESLLMRKFNWMESSDKQELDEIMLGLK